MGDGTTSPSDAKIEQLVSTGYLKDIPVGGLSTPGFTNNWYIDETRGAALTFIGTDEGDRNICQAARKRLGFTDATKSCEAADIAPTDPRSEARRDGNACDSTGSTRWKPSPQKN